MEYCVNKKKFGDEIQQLIKNKIKIVGDEYILLPHKVIGDEIKYCHFLA